MALRSPSLFLYGFQITALNKYISFRAVSLETPRLATLRVGFYSLASLASEVVRALAAADPQRIYSMTSDRSLSGGTQNRTTIATNGAFFQLLFSSGNPANPATLLGFNVADYTGATTYTGSASAGTSLIPNQIGYNFLSPDSMQKNFGVLNVAASGLKEPITFSLQSFWQVQFRYIPESVRTSQWLPLVQWLIQQREIEFIPEVTTPTVFYTGTLEEPNSGLEMTVAEMLPSFPFEYQTPVMKFRVRIP